MVRLQNSAITATVGGGPETVGGNITIDPEFVILEKSQIISNAVQGRGGDIAIEAGVFLADPTSVVSAIALDSQVGIDGEIDIRVPVTNLSGVVAPLPQRFTQAATLLRQRCAERWRGGQVSSLILASRDGVPAEPEGGLPSPLAETEGLPIDGAGHTEFLGRPFTSSHALVRDEENGTLQLRGWDAPPFSQAAWNLECSRW